MRSGEQVAVGLRRVLDTMLMGLDSILHRKAEIWINMGCVHARMCVHTI